MLKYRFSRKFRIIRIGMTINTVRNHAFLSLLKRLLDTLIKQIPNTNAMTCSKNNEKELYSKPELAFVKEYIISFRPKIKMMKIVEFIWYSLNNVFICPPEAICDDNYLQKISDNRGLKIRARIS